MKECMTYNGCQVSFRSDENLKSGLEYSSMVECLPSLCEAWSLISSTEKKKIYTTFLMY
jgi:hypothetical protein